ncbi:MAG: hypothetical protein BWY98_00456 [Tenericutes bacterium ADurb.BinA155]|nr:MAG: hypothetical protein BWY98_00456 [Tenericutes bacterium ADurb.BinA155]
MVSLCHGCGTERLGDGLKVPHFDRLSLHASLCLIADSSHQKMVWALGPIEFLLSCRLHRHRRPLCLRPRLLYFAGVPLSSFYGRRSRLGSSLLPKEALVHPFCFHLIAHPLPHSEFPDRNPKTLLPGSDLGRSPLSCDSLALARGSLRPFLKGLPDPDARSRNENRPALSLSFLAQSLDLGTFDLHRGLPQDVV